MVRQPNHGAWCGYVGVPKTHPAYGKGYDDVDVEVHGGLTYARECQGHVCHADGIHDDVWWLGFDCCHAWDIAPAMSARLARLGADFTNPDDVYRDQSYVTAECNRLAEQLAAM